MTETEFLGWVNRLDGYLSAVSHLNDRIGSRHFFFAFALPNNLNNIIEFLINRFDDKNIEIQKLESYSKSIRVFSDMVQRNIFINFLLGDRLHEVEKENFIKEQLIWHVEDYITMLETVADQKPESWVVKHSSELEMESMVFKFDKFSFAVTFGHDTKMTQVQNLNKA